MCYALPFDRKNSIEMDPALFNVRLAGHSYHFTQQEYLLLEQLLQSAMKENRSGKPVRALSRAELLCGAWGSAAAYATRTVDVHVQRLRAKLGADVIDTVYRQGYRIDPTALMRLAVA